MTRGRKKTTSQPTNGPPAASAEAPEVLTLAEAARYLRVPESDVVRFVATAGLPGRQIGADWRFLKTAIDHWLGASPKPSSPEALFALAGSWARDTSLTDLLEEIYRQRGRPLSGTQE